jgi:hypothetical protein
MKKEKKKKKKRKLHPKPIRKSPQYVADGLGVLGVE